MGVAAILVMWPSPFVYFFFLSLLPAVFTWYLVLQITQQFLRKTNFKFENGVAFVEGQIMTLTFNIHVASLNHLVQCSYQLWGHGCNRFLKINNFHLLPYKCLSDQTWPWRKIAQGQARVLIEINITGWHSKSYIPSFYCNRPLVLEKKISEGFLPYMGVGALMVMWPSPFV